MDTADVYRDKIEAIISRYAAIPYSYGDIQRLPVFDRQDDHYLLVISGWDEKGCRMHGVIVHIDIIDGKIWIQRDGTEAGIATDLERVGIPKDRIVLGFQPPEVRPYTEYAVA